MDADERLSLWGNGGSVLLVSVLSVKYGARQKGAGVVVAFIRVTALASVSTVSVLSATCHSKVLTASTQSRPHDYV